MRKLSFVFTGIFFLASLSVAAADPFNTYLGSFNNVYVYSNGSPGYFSKQTNKVNGYITGYKWQCVEFVNRYFWLKFGKKLGNGDANTYYANASSKGLNKAANGGTNKPQVGNILASNGGSNGHVAIIRSVPSTPKTGDYTIYVAQQNFKESSQDVSYPIKMKVTKDSKGAYHYTVSGFSSSYPVQGWMWPK